MAFKNSETAKAYYREYNKKRNQKPETQKYYREREKTPERKLYQAKRRAKPEEKAKAKKRKAEYRAKPEVKAHIKKQSAEYYSRPEIKARIKEYQKNYHKNLSPEAKAKNLKRYRDRYAKIGRHRYRRLAPELLKRDGPICGICGGELDLNNFHVDHIIPASKGGTSDIENLQLAHPICNLKKGDQIR